MKTILSLVFCILISVPKFPYAQCPDTGTGTLQSLFKVSNSLSGNCLANYLEKLVDSKARLSPDSVDQFFTIWSEHFSIDNEVLFSCYRNIKIYKNRVLFSAVLRYWEKKYGSFHEVCTDLINAGFPAQADTVFSIFDLEGRLDVYDWITWARVKGLIREEKKIPDLVIRIIQREPKLRPVVFNQFARILQDCSPQLADSVLIRFRELYFGLPDADTLDVRNWLTEIYDRLRLYDQQIAVLQLLDMELSPVSSQLIGIARSRFTQHLFKQAVSAAFPAYSSALDNEGRQYAATILYQAYLELGKSDSAMIWMNRANMRSEYGKVGAIVLLQNSNQLQRASSLIDSLRPSLSRDSLSIRQLLLQGEREKAADFLKECRYIARSEMSLAVWTLRTLLFNEKTAAVITYLDTLKIQASWEYARELISAKYWVQFLQNSPTSLAVWAQIEYNLFTGSLLKAKNVLVSSQIQKDHKCKLALYLSKLFNEKKEAGESLQLLRVCEPDNGSVEQLFLTAEALFYQGASDSARQILTKIVLENSNELFSEKARVLLSVTGRNAE